MRLRGIKKTMPKNSSPVGHDGDYGILDVNIRPTVYWGSNNHSAYASGFCGYLAPGGGQRPVEIVP